MKLSDLLRSSLILTVSGSILFFSCENDSKNDLSKEGDYLPYTGSVYLVSPQDISSPIQVSSGDTSYELSIISVDSFESSTGNYSGLRLKYAVWLENNVYITGLSGNVDFKKSQVSNLSDVCSIDGVYGSIVKADKYYMVVKTKGADSNCYTSDDKSFLINSGMSSTDNALPLNGWKILTHITGGINDPYISGFLMYNGNNGSVQSCSTDLTACSQLITGAISVERIAVNNRNGHSFYCIENSSGSIIFEFDGVSLINRNISCDNSWDYNYDGTAIYSVHNDKNLYKLSFNDSNWVQIYDGGDMDHIFNIADNYLLLSSFTKIIGVYKDGSSSWDLNIPTINGTNKSISVFSIENTVYLTFTGRDINGNIVDIKACKAAESQTLNCENNSYWLGYTAGVNGRINLDNKAPTIHRLLKVENVDIQGERLGGILYSLNPDDVSSKLQVGTIPENFKLSFWGGIGRYTLLSGYDSQNRQYDVFFLDLDKDNSLKQITHTTSKNESPFLIYF
jgi:hypothetical protein